MATQAIDGSSESKPKESPISRDELKHYATLADVQKEHKEQRSFMLTYIGVLIAVIGTIGGSIAGVAAYFIINSQKESLTRIEARMESNHKELKDEIKELRSVHLSPPKKESSDK